MPEFGQEKMPLPFTTWTAGAAGISQSTSAATWPCCPNGSSWPKIDLTGNRERSVANETSNFRSRCVSTICCAIAFRRSMKRFRQRHRRRRAYANVYRGVFPIKVNQLREVVEEILDAGKPYHFGIEAGSKPESVGRPGGAHAIPRASSICNGYKDTDFIRKALLGRKLGKTGHPRRREARGASRISSGSPRRWGSSPMIGLRVRLLSKGAGKWATSRGARTRSSASPPPRTRRGQRSCWTQAGLAHVLKLVHFHIGSQVPDIGIDQARRRRGRALLRQAPQDGPRTRVYRRGRRPGRRLRRLAHDLRQLDELLARRSTRATSSTTSWRSATPRRCRIPPS